MLSSRRADARDMEINARRHLRHVPKKRPLIFESHTCGLPRYSHCTTYSSDAVTSKPSIGIRFNLFLLSSLVCSSQCYASERLEQIAASRANHSAFLVLRTNPRGEVVEERSIVIVRAYS